MEKILASIFFLTVITMLAAARFGLVWAGGAGPTVLLPATVEISNGSNTIIRVETKRTAQNSEAIKRGEKFSTGNNSRALIRIGQEIIVALDQNTDVILENLSAEKVEIKIIRGRLLANTSWETDKLIISTPISQSSIKDSAITAVRYDFLDQATILPINTVAQISIKNDSLQTKNAINIQEVAPFTISPTEFNLNAPEVADFYQWARRY
jgi:hypothetical protein